MSVQVVNPKCISYDSHFLSIFTTGLTAVVTGGRLKIGYYIVLRLLQCGARVIATTRFPHDATKRFAQEKDYKNWADRLTVYPLDLKHADGMSYSLAAKFNFLHY